MNNEFQVYGQKYHLSTEGYYFEYRPDKNNSSIMRATLYETATKNRVNDVRVSAHEDFGIKHKSHFDVINFFEVELTLKQKP